MHTKVNISQCLRVYIFVCVVVKSNMKKERKKQSQMDGKTENKTRKRQVRDEQLYSYKSHAEVKEI